MYILTNSIFRAISHKRLLKRFDIEKYFEEIYSSADYDIRKSDKKIFNIIIDEILSENIKSKIDDIFYIRNDYTTDIIGAKSISLKTIWYNKKHLSNKNKFDIWDINDFRKTLNIVSK